VAVRKAIVSVWDKTGIPELAAALHRHGFEILSTSKTAQVIEECGVPVTQISEYTGAPEILGGRVKTIHPKIAGGILTTREDSLVEPIDIVVCNLYPFGDGLSRNASHAEMVELIDIGGVTLLRSAAKNHSHVAAVSGPEFYPELIAELDRAGEVGEQTRLRLARRAFEITSEYDRAIADYFRSLSA
jgi:phosphoribosylaminoimidazolecarboxamide formyltransferase/IMP cyclohydrolase